MCRMILVKYESLKIKIILHIYCHHKNDSSWTNIYTAIVCDQGWWPHWLHIVDIYRDRD